MVAFGCNKFGKLGVDKETLPFTHIPQKVNLPPCKQILCGDHSTTCLTDNGFVYSFGLNSTGQLGLGNNEECDSPQKIELLKDVEFIECGNNFTFCKTINNEIYSWGANYYGQLGLGNRDKQNTPILCSALSNENIIDIKCGIILWMYSYININFKWRCIILWRQYTWTIRKRSQS